MIIDYGCKKYQFKKKKKPEYILNFSYNTLGFKMD